MSNKIVSKELDLNGRTLKLESGFLAQQADSAVVATWGESVILATLSTKPTSEPVDHFPLSVEYVEKYYAGGRITAQKFVKRENRPTDEAILTGRAIDRSIRPLFPKEFHNEVQIILTVLSYDGQSDMMTLGLIAASAVIQASSVPWNGPVVGSRVGFKDGAWVENPKTPDLEHLDLDLFIASTSEKVVMIEAEGKEIEDSIVFEGMKKAHEVSLPVVKLVEGFGKEAGREKQKIENLGEVIEEAALKDVKAKAKEKIEAALFDATTPWHEATGDAIKSALALEYKETLTPQMVSGVFDKVAKEIMNDAVLNKGKRVDGRAMEEVRPIEIKTGLLPRVHGSAVFQRGSTQVLSIATIGPLSLSQTLEGMTGESLKRFMHHYNMSINPFATGEVKRIGSTNRRDIGHGTLVEKSLVNILPDEREFPYAIRVVSEVLAANASTSMASLCASTLALLNAGVPLKNPVAGIALGLLSNDKKFQVITDMQATEDFYGEMDFKVSGSVKGVTAIQMDTKLTGITFEIIEEALKQGKAARELIIAEISKALPSPSQISQYAPKIEITKISPEHIGALIGPGGKNINGIIAKTGAQIDIEEDGTVMISSVSKEAIDQAMQAVTGQFKSFEVGEEFNGKVVRIAPFGAFVEIAPGKDGLVHVSQMAPYRVEDPSEIVSEGQEVKVRVTDVSPDGKVGLSMLFGDDRKPESESRPQGRDRGGDDRPSRPSGGFDRPSGGGYQSRDRAPRSGGFDRPSGGGFDRNRSSGGGFGRRDDRGGDRGPSRGFGSRGGGFGGGDRRPSGRGPSSGGPSRGFGGRSSDRDRRDR